MRSIKAPASEKIKSFIDHLEQDIGIDISKIGNALSQVIASLKNKEASRGVNALLFSSPSGAGIVVPLHIQLQDGKGEVKPLVTGSEKFKMSIKRATQCLVGSRFLNDAHKVLYSLDITEADYSGDSIGLPAAVAICAAINKELLDPYTAFTGNINLEGEQFKITAVKGIPEKLDAAILNGCRRVFMPKENSVEVTNEHKKELQIHFVDDITNVLLTLQKSLESLPGDSLQIRKINKLRAYCLEHGWHLSEQISVQDGLQFTIAPPNPPELKVNIYNTGAHSPKKHDSPHFQEILDDLVALDQSKIPIQNVNQVFLIKDRELQSLVKQGLDKIIPSESRDEQYCEYSYTFENGKEKIVIKQFSKGKLVLQGRGGELYKKILDIIIGLYNIKNPTAKLSINDYIKYEQKEENATKKRTKSPLLTTIPLPHIGTDESGKGDYFGPLVIAGVWIDDAIKKRLESIGVKDSKLMSDKRCRELASQIRSICKDKFAEVEIAPEKYNALYEDFKKESKNLNHLLAWGHARAIENLLARHSSHYAIADQFGNEKFILNKLQEKGKKLELIQMPKAEQNIAVAAASILARARFLEKLSKLSSDYQVDLPKGVSTTVVNNAKQIVNVIGKDALRKVAKMHFKTTNQVLSSK